MPLANHIDVLIVGDQQAPEFAGLLRWVEQNTRWRCHRIDSNGSATSCGIVLLLTARPGRFSPRAVQRICAQHPLAGPVQVIGPWCYGEGRTGPALEGVERMAWFEWPYRLPQIGSETANLPRTATPQERIVAQTASLAAGYHAVIGNVPAKIGVVAPTSADFQMLASACRALKRTAVWFSEDGEAAASCSAIVAMCPGTEGPEFTAIAQAFEVAGEVPKVVCLGTPTLQDWHKAQAAGATALLGQPFRLADLAATVAGCARPV